MQLTSSLAVRTWAWLFAASCAHVPATSAHVPATSAPVVAEMHRDECLGPCPTYTVTLYRDGVVEYDGQTHVAVVGHRVGKVGPDVIAKLENELARIDFLRLPRSR